MNRIRILQIVAGLDIGHTFGGAERSGLELACALDPVQFDVNVCGFWRSDSPAEAAWQSRLQAAGIPVFFATSSNARRNSSDFFAGARRIVDACRSHPTDIIHAHHEGGALAALLARMRGGTRVAMRTTHVPLSNEWGAGVVSTLMRGGMSHFLFPLCLDAEVSISRERCDMLDGRWIAGKMKRRASLIHNARRLDVQAVRVRAQQPAVIGCVARLSPEKGVDRLINAIPFVRTAHPDAELMLVGDGPMLAQLQTLAQYRGMQEKIHFLGQRDDVPALLARMSLFVLPSLYEGVSTALLEAIAAGVPVVVSDVAGNKALIADGHSGWLADTARPESFAGTINAALSDPVEGARRAGVAQQVLDKYSIEEASRAYTALYNQLVVQRAIAGNRERR